MGPGDGQQLEDDHGHQRLLGQHGIQLQGVVEVRACVGPWWLERP